MSLEARTEDRAPYHVGAPDDDAIVEQAISILERRMRRAGEALTSPRDVFHYFRLRIGALEREVFHVALLDTQNRLIQDLRRHMAPHFRTARLMWACAATE